MIFRGIIREIAGKIVGYYKRPPRTEKELKIEEDRKLLKKIDMTDYSADNLDNLFHYGAQVSRRR